MQFHVSLAVAGLLGSVFGMLNLFSRPSGGMISDWAAQRWGMRGRLWALWTIQTLSGLFCLLLGTVSSSLGATMAILIIFSIFCQQSCGLSFGVVPFVSKRSTGLVSGFVGAGGNAGGAITQAVFFTYATLPTDKAFIWMGVMSMCMTALYLVMYFPMWGGFFAGPKPGVTEEDYYLSEYTQEEIGQGMATASIKFAYESRSQRGVKGGDQGVGVEAAPKHIVASSA
jgi:NNP family nitrate/nitrite transporter-like MFS transporter